ncbi:S1/P1 nuclease [Litoribacter alkaliphilus]|uniref:S1/P1 nuclease n=1 Tax=Litoribacter ruber TaxID=702568 RepID=A0AAP2G5W7_9BACT|nr:S1/P1 nuclease [Litoribacter alkaliphilus]MBS9525501.1 S1/P1 nuclease [Litoribacter alkaliphilus]
MKKTITSLFLLVCFVTQSFGWGQNGHRVVGQLAEWHLNKKARKNIEAILRHESIPMVANWMDEIRSDNAYDHTATWHWVTIPDGESYDREMQEAAGDAFQMLNNIIAKLKGGDLSEKEEREYLKMLIHIVGDLHQPLHVGRGDDKGGNDVRVFYFNQETNLHSVWDTKMIEGQNLSFTEIATHLNKRADAETVKRYQKASLEDWLTEAMELRPMVYDLPDNKRLSYQYNYKYYHHVEERLLAAGLRLAGLLNEIYG